MLKIKICGITCVEDAMLAAQAGADALGLNFYAGTPRCVTVATAAEIVRHLPPFVEPVGLFVDHPPNIIREVARRIEIRTLQLHGTESADTLVELNEFRLLRALRVGGEGLTELDGFLKDCASRGRLPDAILIDARVPSAYGGTGETAPWDVVAENYQYASWPPLILAGGLTPENVADAIARVRPWAVDVASGVEEQPGRKSAEKVRRFVERAREAFDRLAI